MRQRGLGVWRQFKRHILVLLSIPALCLFNGPAFAQSALLQSDALDYDEARGVLTMAPLLERVMPGVVSINTIDTAIDDDTSFGGIGSGVIIDAERGHVITNHHVIENATEISVTLSDRRRLTARVIGSDPDTDLALLQISPAGLKALALSDDDSVRVGDFVIAIGNPYGLRSTVTSGIVSATGREGDMAGAYSDFIQTDASINPGNSGGPLLNTAGNVVGINASILTRSGSSSGIGFAVPSHIVRNVVERLARTGEVRRGRIGVMIQAVPSDRRVELGLPDLSGAYITDVTPAAPAARAGLKVGDVVIRLSGRTIHESSDLRHAVGLLEPGERATLAWYRNGELMSGTIQIEATPNLAKS